MRAKTLQYLLSGGAVLLLIATAASGFYSLWTLKTGLETGLQVLEREMRATAAVESAAIHFKTQVQEWKNILLRGNDTQAFEKYKAAFAKEETRVQEQLKQSGELMRGMGRDTAPVDNAIKAHRELGPKYRTALESFDAKDTNAGQTVDKLVQGLDRATADALEKLSQQSAEHAEATIAGQLAAAQSVIKEATILLSACALAGLFALIGLSIYSIRRLFGILGGEPEYAKQITERVAQGDLAVEIALHPKDSDSLLFAMRQMVMHLGATIGEVRSATEHLSSVSHQVSSTAQSLSQGASEQAASVEQTTASMEQMTASIAQNTENAKVTDGMAGKVASEAVEGGAAVKQTVEAMKSIAGKVGIIDDIAYQTNLLALNAAIEAARAGEHGKGFAVVAAEVRKLAERSQVAAQEIGQLAGTSVKMAESAGRLLDEMVPNIRKTSDLVQEIAAASGEQSAGVSQINAAMGQISHSTQQNASVSEELVATAEEMSAQAEQLKQRIGFFKVAAVQAGGDR
jgi:methyl-accepting chemotaxis protein